MLKKKITPVTLILFLVISLIGNSHTQQLRKEGKYWIGDIQKVFDVKSGGNLLMDDVRGDVTIRTWKKNKVQIHEIKRMDIFTKIEAQAAMKESKSGYIQQGNTVRVGGPAFDRKWIQSKFDIFVPVKFNCDIKTHGGDLSVTGIKGSLNAATGGGDIRLMEIDGPVKTKTGGGDIEISRTTQEVTAKTGGGDVNVSYSSGPVNVTTGGGDITISETKNQVEVRTGGGDAEIRKTQGNVKVKTGGGEIEVYDATGEVTAQTGGGEISIRNVTGNLLATTGGGDIEAQTVGGTINAKTGGGTVDLKDIQGALEVTTGGGDVTAEVTLKDFTKDHHMNIQTGGGEICLRIPPKLPATIQAEIKANRRNWEEYEITSDFPLKITTNNDNPRYRIIRATGDINGGGDIINLKTGGGNIRITKLHR